MRRAALPIAAAFVIAAATQPAAAQDKPPLHPARDVSVTYRAEGGSDGAAQLTMSWLAAEQKMRMDMPGGIGWSVTDSRNGQTFMVNDAQRMVMTLPPAPGGAGLLQHSPGMRFTRGGTETILGRRCTVWRFEDADSKGEACMTEDGIMLRSRGSSGGDSGSMTATAVSTDRQDPARFRAPQGYRSMAMPMPPDAPGGAGGQTPTR